MVNRKKYAKPELKTRKVELGVFGEYGGTNGGLPDGTPHPVKITNPLDYMID